MTFALYSVSAITDKESLHCGILSAPQQLAFRFLADLADISQIRKGKLFLIEAILA